MGCCSSSEGDAASKQIEKKMEEQTKELKKTVSMLLLGAGGSGKSTIVKQMRVLYGDIDLSDSVVAEKIKDTIVKMMFQDLYDLCDHNQRLVDDNIRCKVKDTQLEEIVKQFALSESITEDSDSLTLAKAKQMKKIWDDPGMKKTFEIRRLAHVMDNTPYFFEKAEQISDPAYTVTFDDFIRIRYKTTGLLNYSLQVPFETDAWTFHITDVGGQRSERRKWFQVFDGVSTVLYVMSLSGYNQVVYEDNSANCFDETFELFGTTCRDKHFTQTDFIIFLNKTDLFMEKIQTVPFTVYQPQFNPEAANSPEPVLTWITKRFEDIFGTSEERDVFFHQTCATDKSQMESVLRKVQIGLVQKKMIACGLM